jgi:hypothetical protein
MTVYRRQHRVRSNIKFTSVYQERVINVFLHDAGMLQCHVLDKFGNRVVLTGDLYPEALVCVFARLHDPHIIQAAVVPLKVVGGETGELGTCETLFYVEGGWHREERILAEAEVVLLHILE